MSDLSSKSILVKDRGLFFSFAQRMAREGGFGRVFYHNDYQRSGRPSFNELAVGTGFERIESTHKFWELIDQVDVIAYPDCYDGGEQEYLRSQGYPVFGSGKGGELEIYRGYWKEVIAALGLTVAPYEYIEGLDALADYLREHDDCYIKISRMRGLMETRKHIDYELSLPWLNKMRYHLGPLAEETDFIVEKKITTDLEIAGDTIFVGQFPQLALNGVERKDECYAGMVQAYSDLPEQIQEVNAKLAPVLAKYRYANFFAVELRIDKQGRPHPIDPCTRQASPAGEAQLATWSNFPEVVYAGARGQLVQPEFENPYVLQAMIYTKDDEREWLAVRCPEDVRESLNLYFGMRRGRLDWRVPQPNPFEELGSITVTGGSFEEAKEKLEAIAERIEGDVCIKTDSIDDAIKEFDLMKKKGMSVIPVE